jgi:hypothetical protein
MGQASLTNLPPYNCIKCRCGGAAHTESEHTCWICKLDGGFHHMLQDCPKRCKLCPSLWHSHDDHILHGWK